jgi:hypothetical protein
MMHGHTNVKVPDPSVTKILYLHLYGSHPVVLITK